MICETWLQLIDLYFFILFFVVFIAIALGIYYMTAYMIMMTHDDSTHYDRRLLNIGRTFLFSITLFLISGIGVKSFKVEQVYCTKKAIREYHSR